ncbi:MAG: NAD-dependent epimerase/dehydratase family protein [Lachnospiraceae bacterium]|nr:NAD-dependent epimerase/dehydratase family protein [Lachnospiraceae bacterium]
MTQSSLFSDIRMIVAKRDLFVPFQGCRFFVTGATGTIGSMLVKTLLAANREYSFNMKIVGQVRDLKKAKAVYGSMFSEMEFVSSYETACDFIVHTVSPTASRFFVEYPVETIRTSVESTAAVLECARQNNAVMVYLSSMEQYGVPYKTGQIMTEDKVGIINHLSVRASYAESKRLCECLCAAYASEYNIKVMIARLAQTFGSGMNLNDNRMPMQFAKAAVDGRDIILHTAGKSMINFVYLTDAVEGILCILSKGTAGEAYNICHDSETHTVREIAELIAHVIMQDMIRVRIEIPEENLGYAPDSTMYLSSEKLTALGWLPQIGLTEAYRRLIRYIQESQ